MEMKPTSLLEPPKLTRKRGILRKALFVNPFRCERTEQTLSCHHRYQTERRIMEKDEGRRLGGLASLGPLGARLLERKLEKDEGGASGALLENFPRLDSTGGPRIPEFKCRNPGGQRLSLPRIRIRENPWFQRTLLRKEFRLDQSEPGKVSIAVN